MACSGTQIEQKRKRKEKERKRLEKKKKQDRHTYLNEKLHGVHQGQGERVCIVQTSPPSAMAEVGVWLHAAKPRPDGDRRRQ
jgi:hypothetical protein